VTDPYGCILDFLEQIHIYKYIKKIVQNSGNSSEMTYISQVTKLMAQKKVNYGKKYTLGI
jgi:hypothetical protein